MPMRCFTALLATAGLLTLTAAPVLAQQRVALVIGNAGYAHAPQLANPLNDAADMGEALARLGFQVTKLENADYGALRQGLLAFTRAASTAEVAVVFYAGHGIEVGPEKLSGAGGCQAGERPGRGIRSGAAGAGDALGVKGFGPAAGNPGCVPGEPVCGVDAAGGRDPFGRARPGATGARRGNAGGVCVEGRHGGRGRRRPQQSVQRGIVGAPRGAWPGDRVAVSQGARCGAGCDGRSSGALHLRIVVEPGGVSDGAG